MAINCSPRTAPIHSNHPHPTLIERQGRRRPPGRPLARDPGRRSPEGASPTPPLSGAPRAHLAPSIASLLSVTAHSLLAMALCAAHPRPDDLAPPPATEEDAPLAVRPPFSTSLVRADAPCSAPSSGP